jgi:Fur family peroxide stress response transcriptional regulator
MDHERHHGIKTAAINRGYRQTAQRAMILAEVKAAEGHLTAGEIFERVRRRDPRIAYGTVYRSLHLLAQHGLIQELTFADQASRYDGRAERHDHVLCTSCGLLVDVDVPIALIARHVAEERSGFAIASHHTVFAGTCPACRRADGQTGRRAEESRTGGQRSV